MATATANKPHQIKLPYLLMSSKLRRTLEHHPGEAKNQSGNGLKVPDFRNVRLLNAFLEWRKQFHSRPWEHYKRKTPTVPTLAPMRIC